MEVVLCTNPGMSHEFFSDSPRAIPLLFQAVTGSLERDLRRSRNIALTVAIDSSGSCLLMKKLKTLCGAVSSGDLVARGRTWESW